MQWLERLLIYTLCLLAFFGGAFSYAMLAAFLLAFAASCVLVVYAGTKVQNPLLGIFAALAFVFPYFGFFAPAMLYNLPIKKIYIFAPLFLLSVFLHFGTAPDSAYLLMAVASFACVLFSLSRQRINSLLAESYKIRDESKEINLLLEQKNTELLKAADLQVHLAVLSERQRIAREMHDNVGHLLSRGLMQTGALMAKNGAELEPLKSTLCLAMDSMRKSVHDLSDEGLDLYLLIQQITAEFKAYNINLNYDIPADANRNVKYCFAAIIKEAFANTAKHSNGKNIQIDLLEHPSFYRLFYADDGEVSTAQMQNTKGMGLENMRARVAALGGIFKLGTESGLSIHASISKGEKT